MKPEETIPEDRRIKKTYQALSASLRHLIEIKGYDTITVQEILKHANVGRATFYNHFRSKDDLLMQEMHTLVHSLMDPLEKKQGAAFLDVVLLFVEAEKNALLFKEILGNRGIPAIANEIRAHLAVHIQEHLEMHYSLDSKEVLVAAQFHAGAILHCLSWWLENNRPRSAQEMGDFLSRLSIGGLQGS